MRNKFFIGLLLLLFFCCNKNKTPVSGEQLYTLHVCHTCHSLDGSPMIGPSFKNLFGKKIEFNDGTFRIADEIYLIESILDPSKNIVKDFPNLMGSYELLLNKNEVDKLVDFIKRQ